MKEENDGEKLLYIKSIYLFCLVFFVANLLIIIFEDYLNLYKGKVGTSVPIIISSFPAIAFYYHFKNGTIEMKEISRLFLGYILAVSVIDFFTPPLLLTIEHGYVEGLKIHNSILAKFSFSELLIGFLVVLIGNYLFLWIFYGVVALLYFAFSKFKRL